MTPGQPSITKSLSKASLCSTFAGESCKISHPVISSNFRLFGSPSSGNFARSGKFLTFNS
ncbi:hypothetical protein Scep_023646 [Stephania cephalantha]|uniref:Uncharacterized protein n=1 Tax=Stephania cephalantha TaxID=152367 RepID=A0AAP0HXG9_9MAGN